MIRIGAAVLFGFLILPAAAQDTSRVLLQFDPSVDAAVFAGQSGLAVERNIPGLNATILAVPQNQLKAVLESASKAGAAPTVEVLRGDYRELFSAPPTTGDALPTAALDAAQASALNGLRALPSTGAIYVADMRQGTISSDLLRGALTTADGFPSDNGVKLTLAPGLTVDAIREKMEEGPSGSFSWFARVSGPDSKEGFAALNVDQGRISGTVFVGADLYRVSPLGDGAHAIVKVDQKTYPAEHPESFTGAPAGERKPDNRSQLKQATTAASLDAAEPAIPDIRVLVAYTPAVAAVLAAAGQSPEALARDAVDATNAASLLSRVAMHLTLAGTVRVDRVEAGFEQDVAWLAERATTPGDPLRVARSANSAHIVVLVTTIRDFCGIAQQILADPQSAFAVVNFDCAVGNFSFAHELGHLLGLRHDRGIDSAIKPFAYGHGFAVPGKFRTIMAYPGTCNCDRIGLWSNPDMQWQGVAAGTAAHENETRVLNETAPQLVEAF